MNKSYKKVKTIRGMTLVEIIVAVALLSILTIPVISMVYSTSQNNQHSKDILVANSIISKAIEEIKANVPKFIKEMNQFITYYEDQRMIVQYKMEHVKTYDLPEGEYNEFLDNTLEFIVGNSTIIIRNGATNIGEYSIETPFFLRITGTLSPYDYFFSRYGSQNSLKEGQIESYNLATDIYVKFTADRQKDAPEFLLYVLLDDSIPANENINFYIFGDLGARIFNDGVRNFNQFDNISINTFKTSSELLKLTVIAKNKTKLQQSLGKTVSYVKY